MTLTAEHKAKLMAGRNKAASKSVHVKSGGLSDQQAEYIRMAPSMYQQIISCSLKGVSSPRQAIKAKCLDCTNFQRIEVQTCTITTCPLWHKRPYQNKKQLEQA